MDLFDRLKNPVFDRDFAPPSEGWDRVSRQILIEHIMELINTKGKEIKEIVDFINSKSFKSPAFYYWPRILNVDGKDMELTFHFWFEPGINRIVLGIYDVFGGPEGMFYFPLESFSQYGPKITLSDLEDCWDGI